MKKLLLSSFLIGAAFSVNAQDFYLQYEGEPVTNNSTITFEGAEVLDMNGYITVTLDPDLYIVSSENASLTVKVESNEEIQLCTSINGAPGECENGTNITKTPVKVTANTPLPLLLDALLMSNDGSMPEIPEFNIKIQIWNIDTPNDIYSVTLIMNGNAGVDSMSADNNAVVFRNNGLSYDLPAASQINVYSLSGRTVVNANVSGSGRIELGHLAKGVYLYKVAGKTPKTAKIIIR